RLGVRPAELDATLRALTTAKGLNVSGLMTHLACADAQSMEETNAQLALFSAATERVKRAGFSPKLIHAANSAAMLRQPATHLDMVRPGVALFGVHPCPTKSGLSQRRPN